MDDTFLDGIARDLSLDNLLPAEEAALLAEDEALHKSGEALLDEGRKEKKHLSNAERLRRHRLKKKQQRQEMYDENKALKSERGEHLKRIADLELEVESLRGQGVMDLSKENELLRAEIKQHEEYIERVVEVVLKTPIETDEVENKRLLHNYVESGTAIVVGLAYSSIHSSLWKQALPYTLQITDEIVLDNVRTWYQYLPLGSDPTEAKRINIRTEIPCIPMEWRKLARAHWRTLADESAQEEWNPSCRETKGLRMEHLGPVIDLSETSSVVRACWKEGSLGTKHAVFVGAYKEVDMYPIAFDENVEGYSNAAAEPVAVVHMTSCDPSDRFVPKENVTTSGDSTYAYMFRKCDKGCAVSLIESTTLTGAFYDLIVSPVLNGNSHISADGVVHEFNRNSQAERLRLDLEMCGNDT